MTAVIPAYNEANRIIHTLNQVKPFVDEIIVVDDASTDSTADDAFSLCYLLNVVSIAQDVVWYGVDINLQLHDTFIKLLTREI